MPPPDAHRLEKQTNENNYETPCKKKENGTKVKKKVVQWRW